MSDTQVIDMSNNLISSVPYEIDNLTKLRFLSLSNNPLKRLPPTMAKMIYHLDLRQI